MQDKRLNLAIKKVIGLVSFVDDCLDDQMVATGLEYSRVLMHEDKYAHMMLAKWEFVE